LRIYDLNKKHSVKTCTVFLTVREAKVIRDNLNELLRRPEAMENFHMSDDQDRELTCSLMTPKKMDNLDQYSKIERKILSEKG